MGMGQNCPKNPPIGPYQGKRASESMVRLANSAQAGRQHAVWSKNSCGLARVVFRQPAEPFATLNGACTLYVLADRRKEEHIVLALMVPLVIKMRHILRQCVAERRFPKQDKSRQAL